MGPIFGAVLAFFLLKEKVSPLQWLSFLVAFSGVVVLKGFDLRISTYGLILTLLSAFFIGFVFVLIRYLATREHILTIINYFMVAAIASSLAFVHSWEKPCNDDWPYVILVGIFGLLGQIGMTKAFALEKATVLAPFKYMEIVYALVMGYLFWGESYTLWAAVGILLIVGGMLLNVYSKPTQESPPLTNPTK